MLGDPFKGCDSVRRQQTSVAKCFAEFCMIQNYQSSMSITPLDRPQLAEMRPIGVRVLYARWVVKVDALHRYCAYNAMS